MLATSSRPLLDLDGLRSRHPLPGIVGASMKLQRAGSEWKACCPFHSDRSPSFTIYSDGIRWHCFGCGVGGDILDYLQRLHGVSLPEAAAMLEGGNLPVVAVRALPPEPERDTTGEAVTIWRNAGPVSGTPAEAYLRRRGLSLPIPASIRFARLKLGRREAMPCLVALVASAENRATGIQRTYLSEDGRKADLPDGKVKFSLGRVRGGAIRLAPAAARLIVCEGLEDGLSLQEVLGRAVWVAAGASMLPGMRFPEGVREVVVGADGDAAGEAKAREAAESFAGAGLAASIIRPAPGFKDFNDELQGGRA